MEKNRKGKGIKHPNPNASPDATYVTFEQSRKESAAEKRERWCDLAKKLFEHNPGMTEEDNRLLTQYEQDPAKAMAFAFEGGAKAERITKLHYKFWKKTNTWKPGDAIQPVMSGTEFYIERKDSAWAQ